MKTVGIIGSRRPTEYGVNVVRYLVPKFVEKGFLVVSGLASGIDSLAQQTALQAGGSSIGVLGYGYKFMQKDTTAKLGVELTKTHSSGVISCFRPYEYPKKWTFINRNSIIAGLSDLLVVIEATVHSGTNYTVNAALELGIDIYAVPGSIFSHNSKGTHLLIRNGAHLLSDINDL